MSAMSKALTGGTGDVNPQWFRFQPSTTLVVDAPVTQVVQTPLAAFNNVPSNRAVVMEVLKVAFTFAKRMGGLGLVAGQKEEYQGLYAGARNATAVADILAGYGAPTCIAFYAKDGLTGSTANNQEITNEATVIIDCTDGAGHGILLGANQVSWIHQLDTETAQTLLLAPKSCAFLYRFKEVSLQEYMGIIQSQQTPAV